MAQLRPEALHHGHVHSVEVNTPDYPPPHAVEIVS